MDVYFKPYQLQLVTEVETYPEPEIEHEPIHRQQQKLRREQRVLNKEGIERNEVALRRSARERKPNQLEDVRYGKIKF